jgi:hypothetical protein
MSHVDKGALHAYLDGALDEYPAGEARRVREHLDACAECTKSLEEERLLREDTRELLAMAAPSVEAPPLEELRTLARSGGGPGEVRPRLRLYRLSWAASVVLALGAGWMLRGQQGLLVQDLQAPMMLEEQEALTDEVAPGRQIDDQTTVASSGEASTDPAAELESPRAEGLRETFAEAPALQPVPVEVGLVTGAADVTQGIEFTDALANRPPDLEAPGEAVPTSEVAELDRVAGGSALEERLDQPTPAVVDEDAASEVGREAEPQQLRSELQVGGGGGALAADRAAAPAPSAAARRRANADADEPGSLSVSGLDVIEVTFLDDGLSPTGVRILQRLESGDTLELIHLREGVDPGSVPGPTTQLEELRIPRDAGWLIMRAPVARVRLEELLQRLDSIR